MKSVVIYYSFSGNTRKVAGFLHRRLSENGPSEILELTALDESGSFFAQAGRAFRHKRARVSAINPDLSGFDLICIGTPVWAFGPAPAVNTYLDGCLGVETKKIVIFTTYGSGAGKQRCVDYIKTALRKKGAGSFKEFSIQQARASDEQFVLSEIDKVLGA